MLGGMEQPRRRVEDPELGRTDFPRDWWGRMDARRERLRGPWMKPWVQALALALIVLVFVLVVTATGWLLWVGYALWTTLLALHLWLTPRRVPFWPQR
jgi:hypothetical protein